ncbi:MAG TPA: Hpt domain-containing protein [Bacteroidia bacterium]|jgi:HPt (histidine-containing phosphotransfer) domain-containing protein
MDAHKYTDLSYLKEISNGSNTFILQMISVFNASVPEMIQDLENQYEMQNWTALKQTAHKIKPVLLFVGIKELEADIALMEEYTSKETNLDLLPEIINRIRVISSFATQELENEKKQFL